MVNILCTVFSAAFHGVDQIPTAEYRSRIYLCNDCCNRSRRSLEPAASHLAVDP